MDTIIFLLILATLFATRSRRRGLVLTLFLITLITTLCLFGWHASEDHFDLSF